MIPRAAILALVLGVVAATAPGAAHADPPPPSSARVEAPARRADVPPPGPEGSGAGITPRRALAGFLEAAEKRDFDRAAGFLDLRAIAPARRDREGVDLAAMLHRLLVWSVVLHPEALPDETELPEQTSVVVETLVLDGEPVPITLDRVRGPHGGWSWKFSQRTVGKIRALYDAQDRRAVEERMPEALTGRTWWSLAPWQWLALPVLVAVAWLGARLAGAVVVAVLTRVVARLPPAWLASAVRAARTPIRLALGVGFFAAGAPYLMLPAAAALVEDRIRLVLWVLAGSWIVLALVRTGTRAVTAGLPDDTAGELEHRGLRTRLLMVERVTAGVIGVLATSIVLLQFEVVRTVGLSLLASAGIAGVVIGIAAQRTLGGVIGGIELAFSQQLRIGDTVVVDDEWGIVEQMFFTYVIVRCWDDRRLIVPVTRILSQPFENWTRRSPEMLVAVELHADYRLPVATLREEMKRLCEAHPLWDGRACRLQVTDANDRTIKLRALASVDNGAKGFDLRCDLREGLVAFLQSLDGGAYLPRQRVEGDEKAPS